MNSEKIFGNTVKNCTKNQTVVSTKSNIFSPKQPEEKKNTKGYYCHLHCK